MVNRVNVLSEIEQRQPTVLAVGVFDGVHLGHQALLAQVVAAAESENAQAAVLTFFPHPREVISGLNGRYYLTTLDERVAYLAAQGIDVIVTHPFDETVRETRAKDFVQQLMQAFDLRQMWGGSFSLGYRGEGDHALLSELGTEQGFSVFQVDALAEAGDRAVSSSRIRQSLAAGDVADVALCLSRPYRMSGEVVLGKQLGRTIGVPTANVQVWERQVLPAYGVYATQVTVGDSVYAAATNVGERPTVDGSKRMSVEAHLLDFEGDLYGQTITVEFIEHIRAEQKFAGLDALKAQISADINTTRSLIRL